jgi:hypothetical protein
LKLLLGMTARGKKMIKYRTRFNKIEALEVERETAQQVVLSSKNGQRGSRENKVSDWSNWHDSWDAAHAFLIANSEKNVASARVKLERAKGELGQIKGMTPNAKLKGASDDANSE